MSDQPITYTIVDVDDDGAELLAGYFTGPSFEDACQYGALVTVLPDPKPESSVARMPGDEHDCYFCRQGYSHS